MGAFGALPVMEFGGAFGVFGVGVGVFGVGVGVCGPVGFTVGVSGAFGGTVGLGGTVGGFGTEFVVFGGEFGGVSVEFGGVFDEFIGFDEFGGAWKHRVDPFVCPYSAEELTRSRSSWQRTIKQAARTRQKRATRRLRVNLGWHG